MTLINQVLAKAKATPTATPSLFNPAPNLPISATTKITDLFSGGFNLIDLIFFIIGLLFFANLVMVGWDFMMSTGEPKKVAAAGTRLINGFIGLIMVVTAYLVVKLITNVLGLDNLI